MRFLKGLLGILLLLAGLVGSVWVVVPEVMVWVAAMQLRSDVAVILRNARKPAHVEACQKMGAKGSDYPVNAYRLRFVDEKSYVMEAECANAGAEGVKIGEKQLPMRVEKQKGYSGVKVMVGEVAREDSRVVVGRFGRSWWVGFEEGVVKARRVFGEKVERGSVVNNTCGGWGYTCCSQLNQNGEGEHISKGVMDCPSMCFETCLNKPNVTVFLTDPYLNQERVLYVTRDHEPIVFSWKAQDMDGQVVTTEVSFGDGRVERLNEEGGMLSHKYECGKRECVYVARVMAVDDSGLQSRDTRSSMLTVVVGREL